MSAGRTAAAAFALICAAPAVATAQVLLASPDLPRRGSVEVSGGLVRAGGFGVESLPALLTSNNGNEAPPLTLFRTDTQVGGIGGLQGRAGFFVSRTVSLELGVQFSRPVVSVRVFDDFEGAPGITVEETMSRYVIDGSLLLHPRRWAFAGGRGAPFVTAGTGYLRELHEGRELVETGRTFHAGAGVKYWLTRGRRRLGLRGDAGFVIRDGAFGGDAGRRSHPVLGATLSYLF